MKYFSVCIDFVMYRRSEIIPLTDNYNWGLLQSILFNVGVFSLHFEVINTVILNIVIIKNIFLYFEI